MDTFYYQVSVITQESWSIHDPVRSDRYDFASKSEAETFQSMVRALTHFDTRLTCHPLYTTADEVLKSRTHDAGVKAIVRATDPEYVEYERLKEKFG